MGTCRELIMAQMLRVRSCGLQSQALHVQLRARIVPRPGGRGATALRRTPLSVRFLSPFIMQWEEGGR